MSQGWSSSNATYTGRRGQSHVFELRLFVRGLSLFSLAIDGGGALNLRYSAYPFLNGVIVRTATDGTLQILGGTAYDPGFGPPGYGPRFFNGFITYCVPPTGAEDCACSAPPRGGPAPLPSAGTPLPPLPPPLGHSADAGSVADISAALADPLVTEIVLTSNIMVKSEIFVRPGLALIVRGDTAACAAGMAPGFYYYDYEVADYSQGPRIPGSDTPLPKLCTLNAGLSTRIFNVSAGSSLTLSGLALLNGRSRDLGGSVFAGARATVTLLGSIVAGSAVVASGAGGGVYLSQGAALRAVGSLFRDNSGARGGDVFAKDGASVVAEACVFNNSHASVGGSTIYLER